MKQTTTFDVLALVANSNPSLDEHELLRTGQFVVNEFIAELEVSQTDKDGNVSTKKIPVVFSSKDGDITLSTKQSEKTKRISASANFDISFKVDPKFVKDNQLTSDEEKQCLDAGVKKLSAILDTLSKKGFDVSTLLNCKPFKAGVKQVSGAYKDLGVMVATSNPELLGRKFTISTVSKKVVSHFRATLDASAQNVIATKKKDEKLALPGITD